MLCWKSIDLWITKQLRDGLHAHQLGINCLSWRWAKCIGNVIFKRKIYGYWWKPKRTGGNFTSLLRKHAKSFDILQVNMYYPIMYSLHISDWTNRYFIYLSIIYIYIYTPITIINNLVIYPSPFFSPSHSQGYHPKPRAELQGPLNSRSAAILQ